MFGGLDRFFHNRKRKAASRIIARTIDSVRDSEDRSQSYLDILSFASLYLKKELTPENYDRVKESILDEDNKYINIINDVIDETDPQYLGKVLLNLGYEAFLNGTRTIRKKREKYGCNIPWLILFDPTDACNMHCKGCWSGTYGHKDILDFDTMDKIVSEGKELGVYLYMMTGGEPLVRKDDILRLAEKHQDSFFAVYSNSTLIDEALCKKIKELGNIIFLLSVEGSEASNDARRGEGHYSAVLNAMDLFKENGILYGVSICYTRDNIDSVTSDNFIHMLENKGARFGFYFHYMPTGKNAITELLPTPDQRSFMIRRIREIRRSKDYSFYPMDFQNDGPYVGGCIAGGRNYFHINAAGDAEPCVFIHYSNANIHDSSILEILKSPLFMAYHEGQPFNDNHLRPCPMLENPDILKEIVHTTGARQTNKDSPETADELCDKCYEYAAKWAPVADRLWADNNP